MKSFWENLPQPFTVLAPMDGVTDVVFREIVSEIGKPDVLFTEFTNVEGLNSSGREKVAESLKFTDNQHPIVAQIWGTNVDAFYNAAVYCKELGFDGIDINMGCPDRVVIKNGACSALIKNPKLAEDIIDVVKKGSGGLPISVKTRLGFSENQIEEWIRFLLEQNLSAITVHLRTVSELSLVPAHWDLMPKIIELRNNISPDTLIIGNGDIQTLKEVGEKFDAYGCEGIMIGRGIFINPWIFNSSVDIEEISVEQRIELFIKHINLFNDIFPNKNPAFLKKFCKTYLNNFDDAARLRERIMATRNTNEMVSILNQYEAE